MIEKDYVVDWRSVLSVAIVCCGLAQLAVGVSIAVERYPGTFSLRTQFLSELGITRQPSAIFFNLSTVVAGFCLIVFFSDMLRVGSRAFASAGILSAFGLVGIGLTPLDLFFEEHHIFLALWLLPMIPMALFAIPLFGRNRIEKFASIGAGALLICLTVEYVKSAPTSDAPFYQKLLVTGAVFWLLVICSHVLRAAIREVQLARSGRNVSTQQYIERLETTGMYTSRGRRSGKMQRR